MMEYIKSPFNYIGNKYRIIAQLHRYFPGQIPFMLDMFCGGGDVSINTPAGRIIANDINFYVIGIFNEFKRLGKESVLNRIDHIIDKWGLSKTNEAGYLNLREHYNRTGDVIELYVLMTFSFNYQFRFNSAHEYNNPFGRARSSFNDRMRSNLVKMLDRLDNIEFVSHDFTDFDYSVLNAGDFIYADPPYLLTCGSYNDGKRGFRGWFRDDELKLYSILDDMNRRGVLFALSNVVLHKGIEHTLLLEWAESEGYNISAINFGYGNCNYHRKDYGEKDSCEVVVTNYTEGEK